MNKSKALLEIRRKLRSHESSIGSWMQFSDSNLAEILGQCGYDWVAVDLEHGPITLDALPDLFRSLELGNTLPMVRIPEASEMNCRQALDAGAAGVIVPMIRSARQLESVVDWCSYPSVGIRGVGFARSNLFGEHFSTYAQSEEALNPLVVAMIEHVDAIEVLDDILTVRGLDAIFIGPYDLSASLGIPADFDNPRFKEQLAKIRSIATTQDVPLGIHVVAPSKEELRSKLNEGYQFVAYSLDATFFRTAAHFPFD